MYPESLVWWLAGMAVLAGVIGLLGLLVLWLDGRFQRHIEKHHGAPKEEDADDQGD